MGLVGTPGLLPGIARGRHTGSSAVLGPPGESPQLSHVAEGQAVSGLSFSSSSSGSHPPDLIKT